MIRLRNFKIIKIPERYFFDILIFMNKKELGFECENAISILNKYMINDGWKKPTLFHSIRVGTHLYEQGYDRDIVIGGFLHDILEDTNISEDILVNEFGEKVLEIIKANSKDESIKDKAQKKIDLINRCTDGGKESLIVKAADIIDNFFYYEMIQDKDELINHCIPYATLLLEKLPNNIKDSIFERLELKKNETLLNYNN